MTESGVTDKDAGEPGPLRSLKLFLGLSRTPHGILDVATPAMGALLWLGHFPPVSVVILGLITAFAGYTAVYALNDLVDYHIDKERLKVRDRPEGISHIDEVMMRHPLAQGALPFGAAIAWFLFWVVTAFVGAWLLNPFCALLLVVSASLEALYCKLLRVTHLKIIPSAIVKATGGLAGVFAVDPTPSWGFVCVLFLWLAAWEVGGQNIANDIVDLEEDKLVGAKTTATVKGISVSVFWSIVGVSMAAFGGVAVYWLAGAGLSPIFPLGAALIGYILLLQPAKELYANPGHSTAAALFNKASYIPSAFLVLTILAILADRLTAGML